MNPNETVEEPRESEDHPHARRPAPLSSLPRASPHRQARRLRQWQLGRTPTRSRRRPDHQEHRAHSGPAKAGRPSLKNRRSRLPGLIDGQPAGGVQKLEANEGRQHSDSWSSPMLMTKFTSTDSMSGEPVGPGKPAKFDFKAGFTGVFEIELENSAVPIIELQVNP